MLWSYIWFTNLKYYFCNCFRVFHPSFPSHHVSPKQEDILVVISSSSLKSKSWSRIIKTWMLPLSMCCLLHLTSYLLCRKSNPEFKSLTTIWYYFLLFDPSILLKCIWMELLSFSCITVLLGQKLPRTGLHCCYFSWFLTSQSWGFTAFFVCVCCSAAIITAYLMRTEQLSQEGLNKSIVCLE